MRQTVIWNRDSRRETWANIDQPWDILIIGGGITGAGILREAARLGLRSLLVEQRDFAWGTSSRSSKLVHGGLRYLKSGQINLTRASVQSREQLLVDAPGLVDPLGFLLADYEGDKPGRLIYSAGLSVYDLLAMQWSHRYYSPQDFQMMAPYIKATGLRGGFQYTDAQTDDARLVVRVIREAVASGGVAINYVQADRFLFDADEQPIGAVLVDRSGEVADPEKSIRARVIVNATGAWVDQLRNKIDLEQRIRPLRGSHLIFPAWRFPVAQAVSFMHPIDSRPVFAFPWEGVTLVGTTDVDCPPPLDSDPSITADEVAYLMAAITAQFPALNLTLDDIISTFAGIRPVIGTGKSDPSDESRDHVIWQENGLLTVTGGKLTTFRQTAREALAEVCRRLDINDTDRDALLDSLHEDVPMLDPVTIDQDELNQLSEVARRRLIGRYGQDAGNILAAAAPNELAAIPGTQSIWAEMRWSARVEGVVHLDDLLLRRLRIGLLLEHGGVELFPQIESICRQELGWGVARWKEEAEAYQTLLENAYRLPERDSIPDWDAMLHTVRTERSESITVRREIRRAGRRRGMLALILVAALIFVLRLSRKKKLSAQPILHD